MTFDGIYDMIVIGDMIWDVIYIMIYDMINNTIYDMNNIIYNMIYVINKNNIIYDFGHWPLLIPHYLIFRIILLPWQRELHRRREVEKRSLTMTKRLLNTGNNL